MATATKTRLFPTKIDIEESTREELVDVLNQQLADTFDFYSQAKQAHWNVKGMEFMQLHELFDEVADAVLPFVDTLAERVTTLGGVAMGTTRMADDPREGVVDRECRVHGIDNLHVAGSSVFPTGSWAFPTLTIVALSLRLADRLRLQLAHGVAS